MKAPKLIFAALALSVSLASFSQTDTTKKDTTTHKSDTTKKKDPLFSNIENSNFSTQAIASHSNNQSEARNTSTPNYAVINNASSAVEPSQKSRPNSGKP